MLTETMTIPKGTRLTSATSGVSIHLLEDKIVTLLSYNGQRDEYGFELYGGLFWLPTSTLAKFSPLAKMPLVQAPAKK